jgi:hypothetical protein
LPGEDSVAQLGGRPGPHGPADRFEIWHIRYYILDGEGANLEEYGTSHGYAEDVVGGIHAGWEHHCLRRFMAASCH